MKTKAKGVRAAAAALLAGRVQGLCERHVPLGLPATCAKQAQLCRCGQHAGGPFFRPARFCCLIQFWGGALCPSLRR